MILIKAINRLTELCNTIPELLLQISEEEFSEKANSDKWSKKEILGHLIDSATNNHHRLVRGQFEDQPNITYDQNKWNQFNFYNELESRQLITFWLAYNLHFLGVIQNIPTENLSKIIYRKDEACTLYYLIEDYIQHTEHHLKQIVAY
jgi:hypothetical protein